MQQSNHFFASAKPTRLFITVALPGMISMLAASVYSIIEGVFVGNVLGEAAFAAINLAMPFVFINFSLADLVGVGSSVPISISLGRKDEAQANNIFSCSIILIILAALFTGIILYFTSPALIRLMGADGELAELAVKYVRVYATLGPTTTIVFAMDNYLRISGFVKGSMMLNLFMSLLTIILIFIFLVIGGANVDGVAFAACLSMTTCAVIAFVPFIMKKSVLRFVKPHFSVNMIRQIISCGAPIFCNNVSGRVAAVIMNSALLRMGGQTAVAAYSVLMYAGAFVEPLLYGMSDSVQPAIGYNWGAEAFGRVRDIAKCAIAACGVVSVVSSVVVFCFSKQISLLFVGTDNTALMELSNHGLRLFCTAYLFRWFGFAVQSFYSAIEKPLPATILSLCSACVFPIIFIFALTPLQLDGLWLNMTATSFAVMVLALVMLRMSQKKMKV